MAAGSDTPKLRVGLLVDSLSLRAWERAMLSRIVGSSFAEVVLVVRNAAAAAEEPVRGGRLARLWRNRRTLLYSAYTKIDARLFPADPDPFSRAGLGDPLRDVPTLEVTPRQTKFCDYLEPGDLEAIAAHRVDVFIRMGFRILKGEVLRSARYGVWSYHHGDSAVNRGGPPGFWEVIEGHPITGSVLQILTEELDAGQTLFRSYSATDYVSVNRNRAAFYWKTLAFIPRKLAELHRSGPEEFFRSVREENVHPSFYSHPLYKAPGNGQLAPALARFVWRAGRRFLYKRLFDDQWALLAGRSASPSTAVYRLVRRTPPRDRFWADPHVVATADGRYHVFFEEQLASRRNAHISVTTTDGRGVWSAPVKVLERPYHLSYPFVFEWQGDHYMVPETRGNRTIEAYRATRFPEEWTFHKVLVPDIMAVDATIFPHGGRWWMFANVVEHLGAPSLDELFLFSADHPLSDDWRPHPANPIVSDVRRARPAGAVFSAGGRLYRPSQDSSLDYGYGVRINEIVTLDERAYAEREVGALTPDWDPAARGTHTFSRAGELTVIDAKFRRWRWW